MELSSTQEVQGSGEMGKPALYFPKMDLVPPPPVSGVVREVQGRRENGRIKLLFSQKWVKNLLPPSPHTHSLLGRVVVNFLNSPKSCLIAEKSVILG